MGESEAAAGARSASDELDRCADELNAELRLERLSLRIPTLRNVSGGERGARNAYRKRGMGRGEAMLV